MNDIDHVAKAIEALTHLGVDNRADARRMLGMYAGRHDLSVDNIKQVIQAFPPVEVPEDD